MDLYRQIDNSSLHLSNDSLGLLSNIRPDYSSLQPNDHMAKRLKDIPHFRPDEVNRMSRDDQIQFENLIKTGAIYLVQEEGELIVFPASYWHQVYHLQPSIAIASQYCNEVIAKDVFGHMLTHCRGNDDRVDEDSKLVDECEKMLPSNAVRTILRKSLEIRYGPEVGQDIFKQLYDGTYVEKNETFKRPKLFRRRKKVQN